MEDNWIDVGPQDGGWVDAPEEDDSLLSKWEKSPINKPLWEAPAKFGKSISESVAEDIRRKAATGGNLTDIEIGGNPYFSGFLGGAAEGAGNVISSLTTPLNLAMAGAFKGAGTLADYAPTIAKGLGLLGRGLSAPVAVTGGAHTWEGLKSGDLTKTGMGIAEMAGGLAGMAPNVHISAQRESVPTNEPWIPFERGEQPTAPFEGGTQPELPFSHESQPEQQNFKFGPYRGVSGKFTQTGPPLQRPTRPFLEEPFQGNLDFEFPYSEPSQQFLHPEIPDTPTTPPETAPPSDTVPPPESLVIPDEPTKAGTLKAGQDVVVPTQSLTRKKIDNLKKIGYIEVGRNSKNAVFKYFEDLVGSESGEFDWDAMKAGLRRMLGREPTEEEVQRKAFEENSHISVESGVQTGRVAPFTPKDEFISGGVHRPSEISPEVWNTLDDYQKSQYLRDKEELDYGYPTIRPSLEQWNRPGTTQPPVQEPQVHEIPLKMAYNMPEEIRPIGDTPVGQLIQNVQPTGDPQLDTQINRMKEIVSSPRMSNDLWEELRTLGYTVSRNPNMSPDFRRNWSQSSSAPQGPQLGPRVLPPVQPDPNINVTNPIDQLRGQNQLQNISQQGPINEPVDLGPQPNLQDFGQQELPWSKGIVDQPVDADALARSRQAAADRFTRPMERQPEQLSMEAQMKDSEIADYIKNEDAIPPEMRDLSFYKKLKNITNKFIKDESGTFNIDELMESMRRSIHIMEGINERRRAAGQEEFEIVGRDTLARYDAQHAPEPSETALEMQQRQRVNDEQEILNNNDLNRATEIRNFWRGELNRANTLNDVSAQEHAANMFRTARTRANAIEKDTPVESGPNDQALENAENEWEVLPEEPTTPPEPPQLQNPPIPLGLQPRIPRSERIKLSREQVEGAVGSISSSDQSRGSVRRSRTEMARNTWDEWADGHLQHVGNGEPGLSIHANPYNRIGSNYNQYDVVYRGPDGTPVAMARITEKSNGTRTVGTLASNRFRGVLSGRAVDQVGQTLMRLNAGRADGIVSSYTAKLIMKLTGMISNDEGSFAISNILNSLKKVKETLRSKSFFDQKFNSADDVSKFVDKISGGSFLGNKARELVTSEQGATPLEDIKGMFRSKSTPEPSPEEQLPPGTLKPPAPGTKKTNYVKEVLNLTSGLPTTGDLSAPGRQGMPMIFTPEFWKAMGPMFKAGWSKKNFDIINGGLAENELYQRPYDPETATVDKSIGEKIGMQLMGVATDTKPLEESVASKWIETGGSIPGFSAAYRQTVGRYTSASNRAFITFLNHVRTNRTAKLMDLARNMSYEALNTGSARPGFFKQNFSPEEATDLNPYENLKFGKEIADFVNTATGRAPLRMHLLPGERYEVDLEPAAKALSYVMFAPRLVASRMRMMNPNTYIMASPFVRKQYLKAAVSMGAAWYTMAQMSKIYGSATGKDVSVSNDLDSADFGKVRIGNTRLDPGASFQQFLVAGHRLWSGEYISSSTGKRHTYGSGFQAQTQLDAGERLFANKLNPAAKFAYDLLNQSQYQPFHVYDRAAQMFVPLVIQDLKELYDEDPSLIPGLMPPVIFGMGTQTYSKGESVGKIIPPENDWLATGGGIRDIFGLGQ